MINNKSYTGRDINAIKDSIIESVMAMTDKWSDFSESDLGMIYVEVLSGVSDMLNFYLDNQALETFLMTAKQPKNIRAILETMNWKIQPVGSAVGEVTVHINPVDQQDVDREYGDITIPKFTSFVTSGKSPVFYVTTEKAVLRGTESDITIPIKQGVLKTITVKASTLKKDYKYYISKEKVPLDSVIIEQDGDEWEYCEDAFLEIYGGRKYSVHSDYEGYTYILFTNDFKNYLSVNEEEITIKYLISDGTDGEISSYSLSKVVDYIYLNGEKINNRVVISNKQKTYGAYDEEDLTLQKAKARRYIKTMGRCITLDDYDAFIGSKYYISKTQTLDWATDDTMVSRPNLVRSWVVSNTGGALSDAQLTEITKEVKDNGIAGVSVEIVNPTFINVDILVNIAVEARDEARNTIRDNVLSNLQDNFSVDNLSFGEDIDSDTIEFVIFRTDSRIKKVTVLNSDYVLTKKEFPKIRDIQVTLVGDDYGQV